MYSPSYALSSFQDVALGSPGKGLEFTLMLTGSQKL